MELSRCTHLCTLQRPSMYDLIGYLHPTIFDGEHLRSLEQRVSAVRSRGATSTVKITFCGTTLVKYVYFGHILPASIFENRPVQSSNSLGYNSRCRL